ncbi:MAG: hypothetical protein OES32_00050 [Acidobacteriota bacterium]|nr:hypothetical protein [Acidobacteriota bacterium]MDH3521949.1 hypothetical protein [Acidobacteriota bacterium]
MDLKSPQRDLDELERDIRRLQIEFSRYFAGDRELAPTDLREEIEQRVRQIRAVPQMKTVERFRLSSLSARLASFNELFDRKMRLHDARRQSRARPTEGVVVGGARGADAVRRLYYELYKREQTPASISGFREFLERKVAEIRGRTGCSSVQFRVIENDGKRTLKAKAIGRTPRPRGNQPDAGEESP